MNNVTKGERELWDFQNNHSGGFYKSLFQTIAKADREKSGTIKKRIPGRSRSV